MKEILDDSTKEAAWEDFIQWAEAQEMKETPKIEFILPEKTEKKSPISSGFLTFFVFAVVFIIFTANDFISEDLEEEYYPTTENFEAGFFENNIYQNEYTGITYAVGDGFDSCEFYPFAMPEIDEDYTFVTELSVSRAEDNMYISYKNAEYCGCETIEEFVDTLSTSGPNAKLISMETVTFRGDEFQKAITYNEFEQEDGKIETYYYCALVRKVTDDYFAMIEVNTEKLESVDEFLEGFNYGEVFEEV